MFDDSQFPFDKITKEVTTASPELVSYTNQETWIQKENRQLACSKEPIEQCPTRIQILDDEVENLPDVVQTKIKRTDLCVSTEMDDFTNNYRTEAKIPQGAENDHTEADIPQRKNLDQNTPIKENNSHDIDQTGANQQVDQPLHRLELISRTEQDGSLQNFSPSSLSNDFQDIYNNLSIDLHIPLVGAVNEQDHKMITRHQLAQKP